MYNEDYQLDPSNPGLKESYAWPAKPQDTYGLEKLYAEEVSDRGHNDLSRFDDAPPPLAPLGPPRRRNDVPFLTSSVPSPPLPSPLLPSPCLRWPWPTPRTSRL